MKRKGLVFVILTVLIAVGLMPMLFGSGGAKDEPPSSVVRSLTNAPTSDDVTLCAGEDYTSKAVVKHYKQGEWTTGNVTITEVPASNQNDGIHLEYSTGGEFWPLSGDFGLEVSGQYAVTLRYAKDGQYSPVSEPIYINIDKETDLAFSASVKPYSSSVLVNAASSVSPVSYTYSIDGGNSYSAVPASFLIDAGWGTDVAIMAEKPTGVSASFNVVSAEMPDTRLNLVSETANGVRYGDHAVTDGTGRPLYNTGWTQYDVIFTFGLVSDTYTSFSQGVMQYSRNGGAWTNLPDGANTTLLSANINATAAVITVKNTSVAGTGKGDTYAFRFADGDNYSPETVDYNVRVCKATDVLTYTTNTSEYVVGTEPFHLWRITVTNMPRCGIQNVTVTRSAASGMVIGDTTPVSNVYTVGSSNVTHSAVNYIDPNTSNFNALLAIVSQQACTFTARVTDNRGNAPANQTIAFTAPTTGSNDGQSIVARLNQAGANTGMYANENANGFQGGNTRNFNYNSPNFTPATSAYLGLSFSGNPAMLDASLDVSRDGATWRRFTGSFQTGADFAYGYFSGTNFYVPENGTYYFRAGRDLEGKFYVFGGPFKISHIDRKNPVLEVEPTDDTGLTNMGSYYLLDWVAPGYSLALSRDVGSSGAKNVNASTPSGTQTVSASLYPVSEYGMYTFNFQNNLNITSNTVSVLAQVDESTGVTLDVQRTAETGTVYNNVGRPISSPLAQERWLYGATPADASVEFTLTGTAILPESSEAGSVPVVYSYSPDGGANWYEIGRSDRPGTGHPDIVRYMHNWEITVDGKCIFTIRGNNDSDYLFRAVSAGGVNSAESQPSDISRVRIDSEAADLKVNFGWYELGNHSGVNIVVYSANTLAPYRIYWRSATSPAGVTAAQWALMDTDEGDEWYKTIQSTDANTYYQFLILVGNQGAYPSPVAGTSCWRGEITAWDANAVYNDISTPRIQTVDITFIGQTTVISGQRWGSAGIISLTSSGVGASGARYQYRLEGDTEPTPMVGNTLDVGLIASDTALMGYSGRIYFQVTRGNDYAGEYWGGDGWLDLCIDSVAGVGAPVIASGYTNQDDTVRLVFTCGGSGFSTITITGPSGRIDLAQADLTSMGVNTYYYDLAIGGNIAPWGNGRYFVTGSNRVGVEFSREFDYNRIDKLTPAFTMIANGLKSPYQPQSEFVYFMLVATNAPASTTTYHYSIAETGGAQPADDSALWQDGTLTMSGGIGNLPINDVFDGYVRFWAESTAGNQSSYYVYHVTIITAETVTINLAIDPAVVTGEYVRSREITLSLSKEGAEPVDGYYITQIAGATANVHVAAPYTFTATKTGNYTVTATYGGREVSWSGFLANIDSDNPEFSIRTEGLQVAVDTYENNATFTATDTTAAGVNISGRTYWYAYSATGVAGTYGTWTQFDTSNADATSVTVNVTGYYIFKAVARTGAGSQEWELKYLTGVNAGEYDARHIIIFVNNPTITLTSNPQIITEGLTQYLDAPDVEFVNLAIVANTNSASRGTVTVTTPAGNTYLLADNGGTYTNSVYFPTAGSWAEGRGEFTGSFKLDSLGVYTVKITPNVGSAVTVTFTVRQLAPSVPTFNLSFSGIWHTTNPGEAPTWNTSAYNFSIAPIDVPAGTTYYYTYKVGSGSTSANQPITISGTSATIPAVEGNVQYDFYARAGNGNVTQVTRWAATDTMTPTVSIAGNLNAYTVTSGFSLAVTVKFGASGGRLTDGSNTLLTADGTYNALVTENGTYTFVVVSNAGLSDSASETVNRIVSGQATFDVTRSSTSSNWIQGLVFTIRPTNEPISGAVYQYSTNGITWTPIKTVLASARDYSPFTFNVTSINAAGYKGTIQFRAICATAEAALTPSGSDVTGASYQLGSTYDVEVDTKTSDFIAFNNSLPDNWTPAFDFKIDYNLGLSGGVLTVRIGSEIMATVSNLTGTGIYTYSAPRNGTYYFIFAPGNNAGAQTINATLSWLDSGTPSMVVTCETGSGGLNITSTGTNWTNENVTFSVTQGATVATSGNVYQYRYGNETDWTNFPANNTLVISPDSTNIFNGYIEFRVIRGSDDLQVAGEATYSRYVKIDKTVPTINITGNPTSGWYKQVTLTIQAVFAVGGSGAGIAMDSSAIRYRKEGTATWLALNGNTLPVTDNDPTVWQFQARSASGQWSDVTYATVSRVDNVAPTFSVTSSTATSPLASQNVWTTASVTFAFSLTNANSIKSAVSYYYVKDYVYVEGTDTDPATWNTTNLPANVILFTAGTAADLNVNGSYTFFAISESGMISSPLANHGPWAVNIDTVPPQIISADIVMKYKLTSAATTYYDVPAGGWIVPVTNNQVKIVNADGTVLTTVHETCIVLEIPVVHGKSTTAMTVSFNGRPATAVSVFEDLDQNEYVYYVNVYASGSYLITLSNIVNSAEFEAVVTNIDNNINTILNVAPSSNYHDGSWSSTSVYFTLSATNLPYSGLKQYDYRVAVWDEIEEAWDFDFEGIQYGFEKGWQELYVYISGSTVYTAPLFEALNLYNLKIEFRGITGSGQIFTEYSVSGPKTYTVLIDKKDAPQISVSLSPNTWTNGVVLATVRAVYGESGRSLSDSEYLVFTGVPAGAVDAVNTSGVSTDGGKTYVYTFEIKANSSFTVHTVGGNAMISNAYPVSVNFIDDGIPALSVTHGSYVLGQWSSTSVTFTLGVTNTSVAHATLGLVRSGILRYEYQKQNANGLWPAAWTSLGTGVNHYTATESGIYRFRAVSNTRDSATGEYVTSDIWTTSEPVNINSAAPVLALQEITTVWADYDHIDVVIEADFGEVGYRAAGEGKDYPFLTVVSGGVVVGTNREPRDITNTTIELFGVPTYNATTKLWTFTYRIYNNTLNTFSVQTMGSNGVPSNAVAVSVGCIDRGRPVISVANLGGDPAHANSDVTFAFSVTNLSTNDATYGKVLSGVYMYQYSDDGGTNWYDIVGNSKTFKQADNGTYQFRALSNALYLAGAPGDRVSSEPSEEWTIYISTTPPIISVSYDTTIWTAGPVKVYITVDYPEGRYENATDYLTFTDIVGTTAAYLLSYVKTHAPEATANGYKYTIELSQNASFLVQARGSNNVLSDAAAVNVSWIDISTVPPALSVDAPRADRWVSHRGTAQTPYAEDDVVFTLSADSIPASGVYYLMRERVYVGGVAQAWTAWTVLGKNPTSVRYNYATLAVDVQFALILGRDYSGTGAIAANNDKVIRLEEHMVRISNLTPQINYVKDTFREEYPNGVLIRDIDIATIEIDINIASLTLANGLKVPYEVWYKIGESSKDWYRCLDGAGAGKHEIEAVINGRYYILVRTDSGIESIWTEWYVDIVEFETETIIIDWKVESTYSAARDSWTASDVSFTVSILPPVTASYVYVKYQYVELADGINVDLIDLDELVDVTDESQWTSLTSPLTGYESVVYFTTNRLHFNSYIVFMAYAGSDSAYRSAVSISRRLMIDKDAPFIDVSYNDTAAAWQASQMPISSVKASAFSPVTYDVYRTDIATPQLVYTYGGAAAASIDDKACFVTENGTYRFTATSGSGRTAYVDVIITKIDKTELTLTVVDEGTSQGIGTAPWVGRATFKLQLQLIDVNGDNTSGYYFEVSNSEATGYRRIQNSELSEGNIFTVTASGTYWFRARTVAGNYSVARGPYYVNIDTTPPEIALYGSKIGTQFWADKMPDTWTNAEAGGIVVYVAVKFSTLSGIGELLLLPNIAVMRSTDYTLTGKWAGWTLYSYTLRDPDACTFRAIGQNDVLSNNLVIAAEDVLISNENVILSVSAVGAGSVNGETWAVGEVSFMFSVNMPLANVVFLISTDNQNFVEIRTSGIGKLDGALFTISSSEHNGQYWFQARSRSGMLSNIEREGGYWVNIDEGAPVISWYQTPPAATDLTNVDYDVLIKVVYSYSGGDLYDMYGNKLAADPNIDPDSGYSVYRITIKQNNSYVFTARGRNLSEDILTLDVVNIYKEKPVISARSKGVTYVRNSLVGSSFGSNVELFIANYESMAEIRVIDDKGKEITGFTINGNTGVLSLKRNATYTVFVKDFYGNWDEVSFTLNKPNYLMIGLLAGGGALLLAVLVWLGLMLLRTRRALSRLIAASTASDDPNKFLMFKRIK